MLKPNGDLGRHIGRAFSRSRLTGAFELTWGARLGVGRRTGNGNRSTELSGKKKSSKIPEEEFYYDLVMNSYLEYLNGIKINAKAFKL